MKDEIYKMYRIQKERMERFKLSIKKGKMKIRIEKGRKKIYKMKRMLYLEQIHQGLIKVKDGR